MPNLKNEFLEFEETYIELRKQEGWLLNDEQVKRLPKLSPGEPHKKEWDLRALSLKQLLQFLSKHKKGRVLDLGCGNGWMSNKIAEQGYQVTGMDVNETELLQAERVFGNTIDWELQDVFKYQPSFRFDFIILSASFQYFENVNALLSVLFTLLAEEGSIIIMDTFLYAQSEIEAAKKRSESYYIAQGAETMTKYYFHHSLTDLSTYQFEYIFKPIGKWKLFKSSPFPMIRIGKQ